MTPRYSDLNGVTNDTFQLMTSTAIEGELAVFDANHGIHGSGLNLIDLAAGFAAINASLDLVRSDLQTAIDDLTARVTALETP